MFLPHLKLVSLEDGAGISDAEGAARGKPLSTLGRLSSSWLLLCVYIQKSVGPLHMEQGWGQLVD